MSLESPNVTLEELQNDELMYENNGEASAIDRFSFVVSDSVNAGYTIDSKSTTGIFLVMISCYL